MHGCMYVCLRCLLFCRINKNSVTKSISRASKSKQQNKQKRIHTIRTIVPSFQPTNMLHEMALTYQLVKQTHMQLLVCHQLNQFFDLLSYYYYYLPFRAFFSFSKFFALLFCFSIVGRFVWPVRLLHFTSGGILP